MKLYEVDLSSSSSVVVKVHLPCLDTRSLSSVDSFDFHKSFLLTTLSLVF